MSQKAPASEFSENFILLMRNRMALSYFKYGPLAKNYPNKQSAIASLFQRLDKYSDTGNTEWLVDVANFAMIEFMRPSHKSAHFKPTEGKDSPGLVSREE